MSQTSSTTAKRSTIAEFPAQAAEFHPSKNGELTISTVSSGSRLRLWWQCALGHEWQTTASKRTVQGTNCPYCSGHKVSSKNSLAVLFPEVAAQLHPTKNGDANAETVAAGSKAKLWWSCANDHEWLSSPAKRTSGGSCPFCLNRRVSTTNSLAAKFPEIAAQLHPTKNGDVTAETVLAGSKHKLWWIDEFGHEWQTSVSKRTICNSGCPTCSGNRVSGATSLATRFPEIAVQLHPTKNGDCTSETVSIRSSKKLWWIDEFGHEWQAIVANRTNRGTGCPMCAARWTTERLRAFVADLIPYIGTLSQAELYAICEQSGIFNSSKRDFALQVAALKLTADEINNFVNDLDAGPCAPGFLPGSATQADDLADGQSDDLKGGQLGGALSENAATNSELGHTASASVETVLATSQFLLADADAEISEFLVAARKAALWQLAYIDVDTVDTDTMLVRDNVYEERVRLAFRQELDAALALNTPSGWSFTLDGANVCQPNLMQRHVAVQVLENNKVGNWSGTGAGKTVSAVLASRLAKAELTVVICPNNTIDGWHDTIIGCYPDSRIVTKTLNPQWAIGSGPRWLLVNYDRLSAPGASDEIVELCAKDNIDMVVVDEVHFVKQREDSPESSRRKRLLTMLADAGTKNTDLKVLVMSATPVVNGLFEAVSLFELIGANGAFQDAASVLPTVRNAMAVHQQIVRCGSRWLPNYAATVTTDIVDIDCSAMVSELRGLGARAHAAEYERVLIGSKLQTIVDACKSGGKTLVYTEYVEGIVGPIQSALEAAGLSVGVFTGEDKTGLDLFRGYKTINGARHEIPASDQVDVLIGSSAIGTGVDGLQHVCAQLIFATLPWTAALYQQVVGRVHRQGQKADAIHVVIPSTSAKVSGARWSWCSLRLDRIKFKRSLADAAVDGVVPSGRLVSPAQAVAAASAWLSRLTDNTDDSTAEFEAAFVELNELEMETVS